MQDYRVSATPYSTTSIVNQAFTWMCGGLLLTALSSFVVASNEALISLIFGNDLVFFGLIIAELALVFFLSLRVQKLSFGTALAAFLGYSLLNGATLAAIFFLYTLSSIASCFLVAGLLFAAMALYGYTTKRDLTTIGSLALMALFGVIIASLVNLFLHSDTLGYVLSYLVIAIFIGLTAYDTQKIKRLAESGARGSVGILGALALYLDFINILTPSRPVHVPCLKLGAGAVRYAVPGRRQPCPRTEQAAGRALRPCTATLPISAPPARPAQAPARVRAAISRTAIHPGWVHTRRQAAMRPGAAAA